MKKQLSTVILYLENGIEYADQDKKQSLQSALKILKRIPDKIMEYLLFVCEVPIPEVEEFTVQDFYQDTKDTPGAMIKISMNNNFKKWILDPLKNRKLCLPPSTLDKYFVQEYNVSPIQIQSDFSTKPIIPIEKLLAQIKGMIENQPKGKSKLDGLIVDCNNNVFHADLSEIGKNEIIEIYVCWFMGHWSICAWPISKSGTGQEHANCFFAPVSEGFN